MSTKESLWFWKQKFVVIFEKKKRESFNPFEINLFSVLCGSHQHTIISGCSPTWDKNKAKHFFFFFWCCHHIFSYCTWYHRKITKNMNSFRKETMVGCFLQLKPYHIPKPSFNIKFLIIFFFFCYNEAHLVISRLHQRFSTADFR